MRMRKENPRRIAVSIIWFALMLVGIGLSDGPLKIILFTITVFGFPIWLFLLRNVK
jgi:hypothetical protein